MQIEYLKSLDYDKYFKPTCNSIIILISALILVKLILFASNKLIQLTKLNSEREKTIKSILDSVLAYSILIIAILLILNQYGFIKNTALITSAGIFSLIAGLGAQNLVKDVITGFFILFEGQMQVGDFVRINEKYTGTVEEIGLKTTAIREWSLKKIYIPNGEIKTLKNYYKQRARVILDIIIPFEENHELVKKAFHEICNYLNEEHKDKLYKIGDIPYSEFKLYGITTLDGKLGGAKYVITSVVNARNQWEVKNRSYEFILNYLNENNITIAYPRFFNNE